jgi:hypothetical protein
MAKRITVPREWIHDRGSPGMRCACLEAAGFPGGLAQVSIMVRKMKDERADQGDICRGARRRRFSM